MPLDAWAVSAGDGRIWASQYEPDADTSTWMTASIDPASGTVATYPLPAQTVAWADDLLWAAAPARRNDILTGVDVQP